MSSPNSPRVLRSGLIILDAESGQVIRVISLQYNPDSLTRGFQLKAGSEGGARAEALRLTGPPVQTLTLEAELDATDRLADPAANPTTVQLGLGAELAALEQLVYPSLASVRDSFALAGAGMLEIAAAPAPLVLLAFGRHRILPVRITELSITEEAFDPMLNPIRAKVRLGVRVLTASDVGIDGRLGGFALAAHQQLEERAARANAGKLTDLGLEQL